MENTGKNLKIEYKKNMKCHDFFVLIVKWCYLGYSELCLKYNKFNFTFYFIIIFKRVATKNVRFASMDLIGFLLGSVALAEA